MSLSALSIRARLLCITAVCGLGITLISILSLWQIHATDRLIAESQQKTSTVIQMRREVSRAQIAFKTQVQEWKNILLRGHETEAMQTHQAGFEKYGKEMLGYLDSVIKTATDAQYPAIANEIETIKKHHAEMVKNYMTALTLENFGNLDTHPGNNVDKNVRGMDKETAQNLNKLFEVLTKSADEQVAEMEKTIATQFSQVKTLTTILALIVIAVAIVLALWIARSLLVSLGGELQEVISYTERIANGDLTLQVHRDIPSGSLLAAVISMRDKLKTLITSMRTTAHDVSDAALNLSAAAEQVVRSSQEQADAAASMAAAIEEMSVSIDHVAAEAHQAQRVAEEAGELSQSGTRLVGQAMQEMQGIVAVTDRSTTVVTDLGRESEKISSVVKVIKEIADQTNLLALNAAIEAARAGEQGRGFSIVADEVRKLAERTTESTHAITQMIETIQHETHNAIDSINQGSLRANSGLTMNREVSNAIVQIESTSDRVIGAAREISNALREQSSANQQVAQRVERIAQMTEENSSAVAAVAQAAQQLKNIAEQQRVNADMFKV
ncbi:methyl-accepting chemotaxis protein [Parvibium lacunae]|uniref:Methyl-accepting chemotaxis protein n=1 Tax=Parvibium lacunae TaxID=1888893 RepID=A0A368L440_9BURK|nr:methyl-accepting chemotaxis protein [Parvibium lacunae]RCS58253.1 methyl-accepting chemotaxis protein [Parvibium lacunae]